MSNDLIRYDLLVQEALRGVVRKVLIDAATEGLPGEHHFYISFRTDAPGVKVPPRMREKFPDEMTIILQHQFWDLIVGDEGFEVGLSFSNVPEHVVVPYDALTGFFDPSVQFGLKFEVQDTIEEGANDTDPVPVEAIPQKSPAKPEKILSLAAEPVEAKVSAKTAKSKARDSGEEAPAASDKVVSIDAFRKKT